MFRHPYLPALIRRKDRPSGRILQPVQLGAAETCSATLASVGADVVAATVERAIADFKSVLRSIFVFSTVTVVELGAGESATQFCRHGSGASIRRHR